MQINVAQLLKEETGAERDYELDSACHIGEKTAPVAGSLKLIRINRGILVRGRLRAEMPLSCSRCLEEFAQPLTLSLADTYWQTADVITGERLPVPPEAAPASPSARLTYWILARASASSSGCRCR